MRRLVLAAVILIAIVVIAGIYVVVRGSGSLTNPSSLLSSTIPANDSELGNPTLTVTPNPIPSDWESYTSETYDFMIRYPSDMDQETTAEGERFFKVGSTQTVGTELFDGISVVILSGSNTGEPFKTFVDNKYMTIKNDPIQPRLGQMYPVSIAGKQGYAFTVSSLGDRIQIYLPKGEDEHIEIINSTVEPSNKNQTYQKIVDSMLSSLIYE